MVPEMPHCTEYKPGNICREEVGSGFVHTSPSSCPIQWTESEDCPRRVFLRLVTQIGCGYRIVPRIYVQCVSTTSELSMAWALANLKGGFSEPRMSLEPELAFPF